MTASQTTKPTSIRLPDRAFFRGLTASYRRLLVFVKPYWQRLALAGVIVTVNSLLGLVLPLVIRGIIDERAGGGEPTTPESGHAAPHCDLRCPGVPRLRPDLPALLGGRAGSGQSAQGALRPPAESMPLRFFAGTASES